MLACVKLQMLGIFVLAPLKIWQFCQLNMVLLSTLWIDESDWSTVSAEWSDEYMELDVTTPMSEQNVSMVTKGSDMVRCVCEVEEENDFMIQVRLTETHF